MATMDMIKHAGGEPANFLDIGGGASPERVARAFRLVLSDRHVKAILVNVFAGINRCDWVAQGVIQAVREVDRKSTRLNSSHTEIYTLSYTTLFRSPGAVGSPREGDPRERVRGYQPLRLGRAGGDPGGTRGRSEEHSSELQPHRDLHSFLHDALPISWCCRIAT